MIKLIHGDCLEKLKELENNSIDSVVCDPPYGLSFMSKKWDYDVPSEDIWRECLRVLKPGGHLLAFAGTRTQHRMAVRIEDAGFEIRDMIAWVYGSGFPKSLDVSKAIDKCNGEPDRLLKFCLWFRECGITRKEAHDAMVVDGHIKESGTMEGHYFAKSLAGQPAIPTRAIWKTLRPHCGEVPAWVDELVERIEAEREVIAQERSNNLAVAPGQINDRSAKLLDITKASTPAAKAWEGWGTALKPALEPITVARKPITGTVAENVLKWGTGGINVDGCRVDASEKLARPFNDANNDVLGKYKQFGNPVEPSGRFPANLIHDGSPEVLNLFPETKRTAGAGWNGLGKDENRAIYGKSWNPDGISRQGVGDFGSAARFFYCAKANKKDRGDNNHPTVKPTDLMRYLCRLVTPPGGIILDPFMGSGSTGKAARLEGFDFIGIEREAEYVEIAKARIGE